jgi:serine/threonine protein kinase/Tol biopolymer transport system component
MALTPGTRVGPYEILAPIGAGGMGEVYRARDTRLNRTVAIKVLPTEFAENPERRARFEREAKAVSAFMHPHICTLYDIGREGGVDYLVLEYLEGETVADRLKRGPLPIEQALRLGSQIADALATAHRAGIVHRDLKPGNIMIIRSGVKLLDFGLAKLKAEEPENNAFVLSALPTKENPLTGKGSILGTLQYMAPEQLEGREADARTDIFAFGVILYEMVTGKKAFAGKSQASLIAAILEHQPTPMSELQPIAPPLLERVVGGCLAKDPDERWQQAGDVKRQLAWLTEGGVEPVRAAPTKHRERLPWFVAAAAALGAFASIALLRRPSPEPALQRFHVLPPESDRLQFEVTGPVVSPDGRTLALVATDDSGTRMLWIRRLESLEFRPLAGTEDAGYPFWSPDSRFIGFFSQGQVKKIGLDGSPPETLCEHPGGTPRGGTWSQEGVILFSSAPSVYRVSASGGHASIVLGSPEVQLEDFLWPSFLPDGRHFLYLRTKPLENTLDSSIEIGSLDLDEKTVLVQAYSNAIYAPPGYVLYARQGTLLAQPFDPTRRQLRGEPAPIARGLNHRGIGHWGFWTSNNGVLSYSTGREFSMRPTWFDRAGQKLGFVGDPDLDCIDASLSPDQRHVALACMDPDIGATDIHLVDLSRDFSSRLTSEPLWDQWPVWSPDSRRIAFWSSTELRERGVNGEGGYKVLLKLPFVPLKPMDWSPDGTLILYQTHERGIDSDLMIVPTTGAGQPEPYLSTRFDEMEGRFSPDGRWVAYASNESGRFEVYVRSISDGNRQYRISKNGGRRPHWRSDGSEIFYVGLDNYLVAVPVKKTPNFEMSEAQKLFETAFPFPDESKYSVAADGQRFLLFSRTGGGVMNVVLNWTTMLEE